MFRLLCQFLLSRPLTGQSPPTHGVRALAGTLRGQQEGLAAAQSAAPQYLLDSNGNAVVIWGQDISHAPTGQNGPNPGTESTTLTGPGIATKHSGSWVRVA